MSDRDLSKLYEELADTLLDEAAKSEHRSLRDMGILNKRRERTVHEREVSFSYAFSRRRKESA